MVAYVIADIDISDPQEYQEYAKLAVPAIEAYGGRFVVRSRNQRETVEGDWNPGRLIVLEFETYERAKQWWESEAYVKAREIRERCASSRIIIVEGSD